jgi:hypothetical protein
MGEPVAAEAAGARGGGGSAFARNQLRFVRLLRAAGIPVVTSQTLAYLRALELIDLGRREQVFHAARSLLVTRAADLPLFDVLFERFWSLGRSGGRATRGIRAPQPPAQRPRPAAGASLFGHAARPDDPEVEVVDRRQTWSAEEILRSKDFAAMTEEELAAVRRALLALRWRVGERRTRRLVGDPAGRRLDLRAVLRDAARHGGTPVRLHRRRNKVKPRPLVLLADVSGSMERYSRVVLQFLWCVLRGRGSEVECFAFGTRLTRLTPALKLRNPDRALEAAARAVVDWSGGTRIGESLAAFNRRWSRRVLHRGAVAVVISDGWERGDAALLAREMRFLQHRCHRLIWLNPLLGHAGYRPLVAGMAAALPFVDDFLPVHDLASLEGLARRLASLPARRPERRQGLVASSFSAGEPAVLLAEPRSSPRQRSRVGESPFGRERRNG